VRELLEQVREELAAQIVLDTVPLSIEASFGVALFPAHGDTVEVLLQHADAAMYQGKRGMAGVVVYESATATNPSHRLIVQGELRRALEREELVLHYQPKVELATGQICGIEALVRWDHPQRGLLSPGEFLPAADAVAAAGTVGALPDRGSPSPSTISARATPACRSCARCPSPS